MIFSVCAVVAILVCVFVWFMIPYSPLKAKFENSYETLLPEVDLKCETFSSELLSEKPELLQKFIRYSGLENKPMMKAAYTVHTDADFLLNDNSPMCKITYTQANFATICERLAFIDLKLGGVLPFQGLDDNLGGKGRMQGVIAKLFTAFVVQGAEMDSAALVTVLADALVCPTFLMLDEISWQELDITHLKATLTQYGITVSGVFVFDADGAIISFYTSDRYEEKAGTMTRRDWRAEFGGYKEVDGIKRPSIFKAS